MTTAQNNSHLIPDFNWTEIDTILLDMDGTLLDKYFDDYFWEEFVPQMYAEKHALNIVEARKELLKRYRSVESTLQWTDLDYWSMQLGLDIPELKRRVDHLIDVHPYVTDFLKFITQQGKDVHLVTAAHSKTLDIKMRKTSIGPFFDRIICAEEVGEAKENPRFWHNLEIMLGFNRSRTLLADDTAKVLRAAHKHGIKELIFVARPSSRKPVIYSTEFPSIVYFKELMQL